MIEPRTRESSETWEKSGNQMKERPLITFALFAFNQEQFICEAVDGAFAQTYSPLEIILSDDCSTDRTYKIMERMATDYRGPHTIILNRNEQNLNAARHINRVMELSHGELIVVAAGDDVSLPTRTEKLVNLWLSKGKVPDSLHSSTMRISPNGQELGIYKANKSKCARPQDFITLGAVIVGCTHAWTKRIFELYGGLQPNLKNEDSPIGFRASLRGGVEFIDLPLVKYRIGGISQPLETGGDKLKEIGRDRWERRLVMLEQIRTDLMKDSNYDLNLGRLIDTAMKKTRILIDIQDHPSQTFFANIASLDKDIARHSIRYLFPSLLGAYKSLRSRVRARG